MKYVPAMKTDPHPLVNRLQLIHFNDVYNVEGHRSEPCAGAARFLTAIRSYGASDGSLVLFSGDALSPSLISSVTQGRHMPYILNKFGVQCSVVGNHDLDFGLDIFRDCLEMSTFPWLNTNVLDSDTNELLVGIKTHHIIDHCGIRIGLIGLIEKEWVATLPCIAAEDVNVLDICETAHTYVRKLKAEGCHLVIALTHMRWSNDQLLAHEVPELDLILGGHDHDYDVLYLNSQFGDRPRVAVKSGTDYRTFSFIQLDVDTFEKRVTNLTVEKVEVNGSWSMDEELSTYVQQLTVKLDEKMDTVLGRIEVPLDARFNAIRSRETNSANFICDIIMTGMEADLTIINSGSLRADRIIPTGEFLLRDLLNLLPTLDPMVLLEATGSQIVEALENGVSQYPKLEGRFPMIAGCQFAFDPSKCAGQRVLVESITIQDEPIELKRKYRLCVKNYLAVGKDGYNVLKQCPVLIDDENGPILSTIVQNYFRTIQVLKGFERSRTRHRQSIVSIAERRHLLHKAGGPKLPTIGDDVENYWHKARSVLIEQKELQSANAIAPSIDGRIKIITHP